MFSGLVWLEIVRSMEPGRADTRTDGRQFHALSRPGLKAWLRHSGLFLLSVPAAGLITLLLSAALVLALPWSLPAQAAVAIFVYPVLWGGLSAWVCAQERLLKPTLVSAGLLACSGLLLYL